MVIFQQLKSTKYVNFIVDIYNVYCRAKVVLLYIFYCSLLPQASLWFAQLQGVIQGYNYAGFQRLQYRDLL